MSVNLGVRDKHIVGITSNTLLLTSRGDGLGVGYLNITTSGNLTLSLDGTARFYSDALGTLDESTTWIPTVGAFSRYIRVPSGTANLVFSDRTKLIKLGSVTTPSSGVPGWSYNTLLSISNIPRLTCDNWNFPNCIEIALPLSAISTFNFDINDLSLNFEKSYLFASGTITGDLADLPNTCTVVGFNNSSNLITGNISNLPPNLLMLNIGGGNTVTGNVINLPINLTELSLAGFNTITGDIANLPTTLTRLLVSGNNTLYGNVIDLPTSLTLLSVLGLNSITGDLDDILDTVIYLALSGFNTLSGDLANIPTGMTQFDVTGDNTLYGKFTTLPASLTRLVVTGSNIISGDLADLPVNINTIFITGLNTITGSLSSITAFASLANILITGSNIISGDIADIPAVCNRFDIEGFNTIDGDLGDLPTSVVEFILLGNNTVSDYSGKGWLNYTYIISVQPTGVGGLSAAEVDNFFIDIEADCPFTSAGTLTITGTNAAPTATSAAARTSLAAKGVVITTN